MLAKEGEDLNAAGLEAEARQGRQARGSRTDGGLLADEMDGVSWADGRAFFGLAGCSSWPPFRVKYAI